MERGGRYFEVEPVIDRFLPRGINFYYFCGGRGIGKTYSALDFCVRLSNRETSIDESIEKERFIYLRRTLTEAQSVGTPASSPFKVYNHLEGTNIRVEFNSKLGFGTFFTKADEDERTDIGYVCALSTFANLRGVDFSDVTVILFDECISENANATRGLKNEGRALLNLIETINRNRALEGRPEVVLIMLSNPIDLGSPLLAQLGFTEILSTMMLKNQQRYTDEGRSLHIEKLRNHKISELKRQKSKLYKFADKAFTEQSLTGDFTDNDFTMINPKINLQEYKCYVAIAQGCYIYKHKSDTKWHICQNSSTAEYNFTINQAKLIRDTLYLPYKKMTTYGRVTYDSYATKNFIETLLDIISR